MDPGPFQQALAELKAISIDKVKEKIASAHYGSPDSWKGVWCQISEFIYESGLSDLKKRLAHFPGRVPVYLKLNTQTFKSVQILVGEDLYVAPTEDLMNEIKDLVGKENFSLTI